MDELRNLKLEDANPQTTTAAPTAAPSGDSGAQTAPGSVPPAPPPPPPPQGPGTAAPAPEPEPQPPAAQANPVSQDPRYKKYFTMLKMVTKTTNISLQSFNSLSLIHSNNTL